MLEVAIRGSYSCHNRLSLRTTDCEPEIINTLVTDEPDNDLSDGLDRHSETRSCFSIRSTLLTSDYTIHSHLEAPILISSPTLRNRWYTPLHYPLQLGSLSSV